MIDEVLSNGGTKTVSGLSGTYTIPRNEGRHLSLKFTGAGGIVALPPAADFPLGGPLYNVHNWGSNSFTLQSSPNVTVGPGESAFVLNVTLSGVRTWRAFVRSGPSAYGVTIGRSDPSTFESEEILTYSPDCGDVCSASQASQIVPMWINSCVARNAQRDPIRGADLRIPVKLQLKITDKMIRDTNHRHASNMSNELKRLLYGDTLVLGLDSASHGTTSRHPHHVGLDLSGPTWTYPGSSVTVTRKVWKRTDTYKVGTTTYTLECRAVAEWVAANDDEGAWGSIISVYVFSNEIVPTYVDSTNDAVQNNCPFTHDDPCVYGALYAGANTHPKFFHPQLLLVAHIPTTFHAPCGYDHVPVGDELWEECYALTNGAPWSSGAIGDSHKNCVFSRASGTDPSGFTPARCMTIGGDVPISELYPFLVIENGAGYGGTYLKPTNAGWNEAVGNLTPLSDVSLRECGFPQVAVDTCAGHPDEPYGGIGGTHRCFLAGVTNPGDPCYPPGKPAYMTCVEYCCGYVKTYDETCVATPEICTVYQEFRTTFTMQVDDYDFDYVNAGVSRSITWKAVAPDPDYARPEWLAETSFADMTTNLGTWTHDFSGSEVTAVAGSGFVRADAYWVGTGTTYTCGHAKWTGLCKTSTGKKHLVLTRWDPTSKNGYGFELDPGGSTLKIYKITANVASVIASLGSVTLTGDVNPEVSSIGSLHTLSVGSNTISVHDCTYKFQGQIAVGTSSTSAGARFEDMLPEDWNNRVDNPGSFVTGAQRSVDVVISNATGSTQMTAHPDANICMKYLSGGCTGYVNELCGTLIEGEQSCGCTITRIADCDEIFEIPSDFDSGDVLTVSAIGAGNPSAQDCIDTPPCNRCPPPYSAVRITLPASCNTTDWPFKKGMEYWMVTKIP